MEEKNYKEVRFDKYCKLCKYEKNSDVLDPCDECLEHGMMEGTEKPYRFEKKERGK